MEVRAKRITIFSGHYGSGKTSIAVEYALKLKQRFDKVLLADIDIVNPYYRALDRATVLENAGVRLICSEYANSNVDLPAIPQDIYCVTDDPSYYAVLDVGGDDRGALALGRLSKEIKLENNYDMLFVVNKYRPLTSSVDDTLEIMKEITTACGLGFTAIVNNSNLGKQTTAKDVIKSLEYANGISKESKLPLLMTSVRKDLVKDLADTVPNLFSINV